MGAGAGKSVVRDGDSGDTHPLVLATKPVVVSPVAVKPARRQDSTTSLSEADQRRYGEPQRHNSEGGGQWASRPLGFANRQRPESANAGVYTVEGTATGTTRSYGSKPNSPGVEVGARGNFSADQRVRLTGVEQVGRLNGQEGTLVHFDDASGRWLVRLGGGDTKMVRAENLQPLALARGASMVAGALYNSITGVESTLADRTGDTANKELETLLLQSNWAAIYQLFHQRFGVAALDNLDRGYVVKGAVEMTMSIVAKCFALLRSDPHGRLHCTPLHIAALQCSEEAAEVIVRDLPHLVAQTHTPSHSALCPLHIAILCGSPTIVELLLEGKANPNVRTLHDVCPLHIAATTSTHMCQVLLSYHADPQKRDVMGSTSLHYAATFKQHAAMEMILGNVPNSARLACDVDQKRITPLHITCALYNGDEEDFIGPMVLLAHSAKPWQTDVHGVAPCDLVPWSRDNVLLRFFELNSDKAQAAAQKWLDDQTMKEASSEENAEDGPADSDPSRTGSPASPALAPRNAVRKKAPGGGSAAGGGGAGASSAEVSALKAEVERLRGHLVESQERCATLLKDAGEVEHLRAKCGMMEQAAANQQKVFDGLQGLYESERRQHEQQIEVLQQRSAAERAALEARLNLQLEHAKADMRQDQERKMSSHQLGLLAKLQEMQFEVENAKARAAAAEAEQAAAEAKLGQTRLNATLATSGGAEQPAELTARIFDLEGEVQRLLGLEEQARAVGDQQRALLQEFRQVIHGIGNKHNIGLSGDNPLELLAPLDAELGRRRAKDSEKQAEAKIFQDKVDRLQGAFAQIRKAKEDAEARVAKLTLELQEIEHKNSANALKLETRMKDLELGKSQAVARAKADAEAFQRRMQAAEAAAADAQPTINRLQAQIQGLEEQLADEQQLRKKLHNQIQDMKGAIRVFCRFRPMIAREQGDAAALTKADAFTANLQRPAPHNDIKNFSFDAVFDGDSTQEEVFADCRELVQSAVDGYNVTIFAYGQTGAGKTHTMYGTAEQPGLAPRSIRALFDVIKREQKTGKKKFKVKTYMIEVYKQDILDLLGDKPTKDKKGGGLEVKKDIGRGMMYVDGVTEKAVNSPEELMAALTEGEKKRHVTATKMNASSSRSHLLLSIIIECHVQDTDQILYGKITLCDLAGSERPKKSEVEGEALREAIEINKSLSALGDVIEALTKGAKSIPYRNHKLTMLMQDSLGGSAKTLMFVNCSPAAGNFEETQISLKWASRARQVTNDVKRNADTREVARLKQVIAMMSQAQNAEALPEAGHGDHAGEENLDMKMAMNTFRR